MRSATDKRKVEAFTVALGRRIKDPARIYFAGGATALLYGWRASTVDIDLKADGEPAGFFEALSALKEELDVNVELVSPDDFVPAIPGWRDRSLFIARHGKIDFYHYDPYGQALAKLQRGHDRDLIDLDALASRGLIDKHRLHEIFRLIKPELIRFPAIDPNVFEQTVVKFCR
jgi:hypothetical protein